VNECQSGYQTLPNLPASFPSLLFHHSSRANFLEQNDLLEVTNQGSFVPCLSEMIDLVTQSMIWSLTINQQLIIQQASPIGFEMRWVIGSVNNKLCCIENNYTVKRTLLSLPKLHMIHMNEA
jgi:hypothetical protein